MLVNAEFRSNSGTRTAKSIDPFRTIWRAVAVTEGMPPIQVDTFGEGSQSPRPPESNVVFVWMYPKRVAVAAEKILPDVEEGCMIVPIVAAVHDIKNIIIKKVARFVVDFVVVDVSCCCMLLRCVDLLYLLLEGFCFGAGGLVIEIPLCHFTATLLK